MDFLDGCDCCSCLIYWSSECRTTTDPYGKQNLHPKTKLAASFVFTSPYVRKIIHKNCCKFCGTGLLPRFPQNLLQVLLGPGFHKTCSVQPKRYRNNTLLLPPEAPSRSRATDLACILPPIALAQVAFGDFSFHLHIKMSRRFTESLKKMITAVNQVIFKTSSVLGSSDPRPIDESDCYNVEGSFNLNQYEEYIEREEEEAVFKRNVRFLTLMVQLFEYSRRRRKAKASRRHILKPPVKRARIRHPKFFTDPATGVLRSVTPRVSLWWILYIQDPKPENAQWSKTFRRRF